MPQNLSPPDDGGRGRLFTRHLVRFLVVGVSNVGLGYGVFWLSLRMLDGFVLRATAAQILAYAVGTAWSYYWNRRWTFESDQAPAKEATRFVTVQLGLALTSSALIGLAVDWMHLHETLVWVTVMGFITVCNFALSKLFVFAPGSSMDASPAASPPDSEHTADSSHSPDSPH